MQRTKNPIIFSNRRSRLGLSDTVVALILVIVGVSLALLVGSIVGGQLGGWSRKEGIVIEAASASLVGSGGSSQLCVTVQFRNSGASRVDVVSVIVTPPGTPLSSGTISVQPGSSGSASNCVSAGSVSRGDIVTIRVTGNIIQGSTVTGTTSDQRSVPVV